MKFLKIQKRITFSLLILMAFVNSNAQLSEETMADKISYNSTMDADNIYVQLSTQDRPTMLTMLHRGLYVYFDIKGKKKKKVAIQYPIQGTPLQSPFGNTTDTRRNREEVGGNNQQGPDISVLVAEMPKMALYTNQDSELEFHLDLNKLGVSIKYDYDTEEKILHYELTIPKQQIADSESDFSNLSIGIISPKKEDKTDGNSSNASFGGRGQGGGLSGGRGRQGGRSGGGLARGGRGGSRNGASPQKERPEETTIDFWFKVNFEK